MNLKAGSMESGLSTETGSAGIDMILLSFLVLIFLAIPLLMSIFEIYSYVMQGAVWSGATENVLDQVEWQIQTEALSECERTLLLEETREAFKSHFDQVVQSHQGTVWTIPSLDFIEGEPPKIVVDVRIDYEPVTMIGVFISQGGLLELALHREREFPIDR